MLQSKLKQCGHCHRMIMSHPSSHTGKQMYLHKCPHGRYCDRGNKFKCINNHAGCKQCADERQKEFLEFYKGKTTI
jgi:hypothetical protein